MYEKKEEGRKKTEQRRKKKGEGRKKREERGKERKRESFALLCFALLLLLFCFALLCFALLCVALLCFALLCFALLFVPGEPTLKGSGEPEIRGCLPGNPAQSGQITNGPLIPIANSSKDPYRQSLIGGKQIRTPPQLRFVWEVPRLTYPGLGTLATSNPEIQAIGSWARYLGLGTLA